MKEVDKRNDSFLCAYLLWDTYPISDPPQISAAPRSFAPSQKSRRNHRSYVRTEVLSGIVFESAQKLSVLVWINLIINFLI